MLSQTKIILLLENFPDEITFLPRQIQGTFYFLKILFFAVQTQLLDSHYYMAV